MSKLPAWYRVREGTRRRCRSFVAQIDELTPYEQEAPHVA